MEAYMKERIREILYSIRSDGDFDHSDNFWDDGYLDSLDIMELIEELEKTYQIEIDLEYIKGSYFSSYDSIIKLVEEVKNGK